MKSREIKILVIGAITIMVLSALVTTSVYYLDIPLLGGDVEPESSHPNFQLGQAVAPCEQEIRAQIKHKIVNKSFDSLSSRYERDRNAYLIFFAMDTVSGKLMRSFHVKCEISAATNRVRDFEMVTVSERRMP